MPSLLLVVFLLQLLTYVINTVGAQTIDQLVSFRPRGAARQTHHFTDMGPL